MKKLTYKDPRFLAKLERFASDRADSGKLGSTVAGILDDVGKRGDKALIEYTERFDGFRSTARQLKVDPGALKAAIEGTPASLARVVVMTAVDTKGTLPAGI